jgi:AcrR family transcriptional regulator
MGFWLKHIKKLHANGNCPLGLCPTSSSRMQQKIAQREQELITLAHELVDEVGFAGLTMDKLVQASEYSKGTIYKHFASKEDLLSALSARSLDLICDLFKKAHEFKGNSREVALATAFAYHLYSQLEPTLFMCVLSAKTPAVMEKTSPDRLSELNKKEQEITELCEQLFAAGRNDGSLVQNNHLPIAALSFSMWAMSFGTNALLMNAKTINTVEQLDAKYVLLTNANLVYDGMHWQPLSTEFDYLQTWARLEEYFAEYIKLLK